MDSVNSQLAIEYAMARRQYPAVTTEEIVKRLTERLTAEQELSLAEDALLWHHEPASRPELALMAVRNFVLAIEADPDEDETPPAR